MKKTLFLLLIVLLICFVISGCGRKGGLDLHETPQEYVLEESEMKAMLMPRVRLYENGNATLSQPMISSYAISGIGHYELNGDELTVSHGGNISASFTVSDNGDTLTLISSTLNFTKPGTVYKYRPNAEYLSQYDKVDGENLTVDKLRGIVEASQKLLFADFDGYEYVEVSGDERIFDVDGQYRLRIYIDIDGVTHSSVSHNSSGEGIPLDGKTIREFDNFFKR